MTIKRPVHKAAVLDRRVQVELNRKHPEPMTLMHKREKNGELPSEADTQIAMIRCGRVYCKPEVSPGLVEKAALATAAWDNSDPFAYGRTALHVRQGYLSANDLIKEMSQRTLARQAAKRKEVDDAKSHT